MQKIASFLVIVVMLSITATSLSSANFINAQKNNIEIITPSSFNPDNKKTDLDLNQQDQKTIKKLLDKCEAGVLLVEYKNKPLIICLIDENKTVIFDAEGNTVNIKIDIRNVYKTSISTSSSSNNDNNNDNDNTPDRDCLFNPSLPKCAAVDGECPDGFNQNGYDQCVPKGGCPDEHHRTDDDETGRCIPNSDGCPDGMEFRPDRKSCTYIIENDENDNGNITTPNNNSSNNNNTNEQQQEEQEQLLTDQRNDEKYDMIDWQSDDGKSDLSIEEMDDIVKDNDAEQEREDNNNDNDNENKGETNETVENSETETN